MNEHINEELNENEEVIESLEEEKQPVISPDLGGSTMDPVHDVTFSEKYFLDLDSFIQGITSDVPESVNKIINNLADKLSLTLGLSVACTTVRQAHLSSFMEEVEKSIFDPTYFNSLDVKQQMELYKLAQKTQVDLIETTRKTVAQNKELFTKETGTIQQLMNKLVALSPDKQQALLKALDEEENSDVSEVEQDNEDGFDVGTDK